MTQSLNCYFEPISSTPILKFNLYSRKLFYYIRLYHSNIRFESFHPSNYLDSNEETDLIHIRTCSCDYVDADKEIGVILGINVVRNNYRPFQKNYEIGKCREDDCQKDRNSSTFTLHRDEVVQAITYGRSTSGIFENYLCELRFRTNQRNFGPSNRFENCSTEQYYVDIASDMFILDYLKENAILNSKNGIQILTGFYNEKLFIDDASSFIGFYFYIKKLPAKTITIEFRKRFK